MMNTITFVGFRGDDRLNRSPPGFARGTAHLRAKTAPRFSCSTNCDMIRWKAATPF